MNDQTKILFLDQSGELGGAELSLLDLAGILRAHCKVITFADGPFSTALQERGIPHELCPLGIDYAKAGGGALRLLRQSPQVTSLVRRIARESKSFDVIVANTPKAALIGALASRFAGSVFIYHLRDILSAEHFSRLNLRLLVWAGNVARWVICNSEATQNAFVASGGNRNRTSVVYNGFDPSPFDQVDAEGVRKLRDSLKLSSSTLTILIAGRLTPWKGQHVLLDALRKLPDAQALVVGEALFTDEDRAYAGRLKELAQEAELAGRVHFLGFRTDLPLLYAACDVVVHASTAPEPFGRVIVEGMLAGKPVIATNAGGAREIVRHGETGLLVEPGNSSTLAEALNELRKNPERREQLAGAAKADALARFSLGGVVSQFRKVLDEAVAIDN